MGSFIEILLIKKIEYKIFISSTPDSQVGPDLYKREGEKPMTTQGRNPNRDVGEQHKVHSEKVRRHHFQSMRNIE